MNDLTRHVETDSKIDHFRELEAIVRMNEEDFVASLKRENASESVAAGEE